MKLDELRADVLDEGITHIEELPPKDFIKAVKNLNSWEITEKMDGTAMQFGFDIKGFFTAREKKGGVERIRNADDWGDRFMHTGLRSGHKALEELMTPIAKKTKLIEKDALYSVEVLFGTLPNAIPYSDEANQIIIIGKDGDDEGNDRKNLEEMKKLLEDKKVTVTVDNVPYTDDGLKLQRRSETHDWQVAIVPKVRADGIKKEEAWNIIEQGIKNLETWLTKEQTVGNKNLSNEELISLPLNKKPAWLGDQDWKEVKAIVAPLKAKAQEELKGLGLEIKEPLLNRFVRGVQSEFGPSIEDGGWIEGVVAKGPGDDELVKIVDKEAFTAINKHNWLVRSMIGDWRNSDAVLQKLKRSVADAMGHGPFASAQAKRYIAKFGDTAKEQVAALASEVDFNQVHKLFATGVKNTYKELEKLLADYKAGEGDTKDLNYTQGVDDRTKETFAEAFQQLEGWNKALKDAKTAEDLIVILVGDKIVSESIRIANEKILLEGGNAVEGGGAIHIDEIEPTLQALSKATKIPYNDIKQGALGSVGKAEFSGDIDIALDANTYDKKELYAQLNASGLNPKMGSVISIPFPIQNYDEAKESTKERTGLVQVDFMFGNPKWLSFGYHSAGDASKYKGVMRTILLTSVASAMGQLYYDEENEELIGRFGPAMSPNQGLNLRPKMRPRKKLTKADIKAGKSLADQPRLKGEKTVSKEEFQAEFPNTDFNKYGDKWEMDDPKEVAQFLFKDVKADVNPEDLDSVETILPLIKKKDPEFQNTVLKRFKERLESNGLEVPKELEKF